MRTLIRNQKMLESNLKWRNLCILKHSFLAIKAHVALHCCQFVQPRQHAGNACYPDWLIGEDVTCIMGCHSDGDPLMLENKFSHTVRPLTDLFCITDGNSIYISSQPCNAVMTATLRHPDRRMPACKGASSTDTSGFLFTSVSCAGHGRLRHSHLISGDENGAGSREPGYPHFTGGREPKRVRKTTKTETWWWWMTNDFAHKEVIQAGIRLRSTHSFSAKTLERSLGQLNNETVEIWPVGVFVKGRFPLRQLPLISLAALDTGLINKHWCHDILSGSLNVEYI